LSRHDARLWAGDLGVPTGSLITTKDRLVKPRKQRALADTLGAHVVEVAMDHLDALDERSGFAEATVELVRHVAARTARAQSPAQSSSKAPTD
jgi:3-oxoadipate enol-lactonase